jgi:hypothetical protein
MFWKFILLMSVGLFGASEARAATYAAKFETDQILGRAYFEDFNGDAMLTAEEMIDAEIFSRSVRQVLGDVVEVTGYRPVSDLSLVAPIAVTPGDPSTGPVGMLELYVVATKVGTCIPYMPGCGGLLSQGLEVLRFSPTQVSTVPIGPTGLMLLSALAVFGAGGFVRHRLASLSA